MVLKDLKLEHLIEAFEKREVGVIAFAWNYCIVFMRIIFKLLFQIDLDALFTMSDDILQFIGVSDVKERLQILEFTHDFNTPQKPKKIPCKHALARNGFR